MRLVLIIHGGAGRTFKTKSRAARVRKKIRRILNLAYKKLVETNALEAVTYATRLLEDDPEFNAGTGSQLQADGRARLSASVMDGSRLRFAGVINIENIKNPILVARALLEEKDRVLAGPEAFRFAKKLGLKKEDPRTARSMRRWRQYRVIARQQSKQGRSNLSFGIASSCRKGGRTRNDERGYDTVGACALDRFGNLASATSTGGRGFERPGRVSDSGMPVANYADERCAVSATGIGEEIIDEGVALKIAARVEEGWNLKQAFKRTFAGLRARNRQIGAIALERSGKITSLSTTPILIFGWKTAHSQGVQLRA